MQINIPSLNDILTKTYYTEPNPNKDDINFYSIDFNDDTKTTGELHWSYSFNYGKMNRVEFTRKDNKFILFTSSVQNGQILEKLINKMCGTSVSTTLLKLDKNFSQTFLVNSNNINKDARVESLNQFGLSVFYNHNNNQNVMKIFTNGLVTFNMTNETTLIKKVIDIVIDILEESYSHVE